LKWLIRDLSHDLSHEIITLAFILNFKRGNEKSALPAHTGGRAEVENDPDKSMR
jgi:hypothetical protein